MNHKLKDEIKAHLDSIRNVLTSEQVPLANEHLKAIRLLMKKAAPVVVMSPLPRDETIRQLEQHVSDLRNLQWSAKQTNELKALQAEMACVRTQLEERNRQIDGITKRERARASVTIKEAEMLVPAAILYGAYMCFLDDVPESSPVMWNETLKQIARETLDRWQMTPELLCEGFVKLVANQATTVTKIDKVRASARLICRDLMTEIGQGINWWWVATNGNSVSASPVAMPTNVFIEPVPEQLFGFKTEAEQQRVQAFLLSASMSEIKAWMDRQEPRIDAGHVYYLKMQHPQRPRPETSWICGPAATEGHVVAGKGSVLASAKLGKSAECSYDQLTDQSVSLDLRNGAPS